MTSKRRIIRKQELEIERLTCENVALKSKCKNYGEEIKQLAQLSSRQSDEILKYEKLLKDNASLNGMVQYQARRLLQYREKVAQEHAEIDRLNGIIENLKEQCSDMHRLKRERLVYKDRCRKLERTLAHNDLYIQHLIDGSENIKGRCENVERNYIELNQTLINYSNAVTNLINSGKLTPGGSEPEREVSADETACNDSGEADTTTSK